MLINLLLGFLSLFEACFIVDVCKPAFTYVPPKSKYKHDREEPQEGVPKSFH